MALIVTLIIYGKRFGIVDDKKGLTVAFIRLFFNATVLMVDGFNTRASICNPAI